MDKEVLGNNLDDGARRVVPVVLCGGSGSRLWPLSRKNFPKQFISLMGEKSLFQDTLSRISNLESLSTKLAQTVVVSAHENKFIIREQVEALGSDDWISILEPDGKNTAAALTLAALQAQSFADDPVLLVFPSDHYIEEHTILTQALQKAIDVAEDGAIAIFGIPPSKPETGYGYILTDDKRDATSERFSIKDFVEKPDEKTALEYMHDSRYFWNSGMFVMKTSVWLRALGAFRDDILSSVEAAWLERAVVGNEIVPDSKAFSKVPAESIDYAVLEKIAGTDTSVEMEMILLSATWTDLGSWDKVWELAEKDFNGNSIGLNILSEESEGNLVIEGDRLITLLGVKGLAVIDTPDALLVADLSKCQRVKGLYELLGEQDRDERDFHRKVNRPWGWYDSTDEGCGFKVKRIFVKAYAQLSLQSHSRRSEHWIVVRGEAEVVKGEESLRLKENESIYIAVGEKHRLSNPGPGPLEIIEVQLGEYLGEDDIKRFEDVYGRS